MTYPRHRFVPGTYKRECDICGIDFLYSQLVKRWDGALVCQSDFEVKDPQLDRVSHRERTGVVDAVLNNDAAAIDAELATILGFGGGLFGLEEFGQ